MPPTQPRLRIRKIVRYALLPLFLAFLAVLAFVLIDGWRAFGHRATGERLARMQRSPQYRDGRFHNPQPLHNDVYKTIAGLVHASPHTSPGSPLALPPIEPTRFSSPPTAALRITWLGHSTILIEIDGHRILTDPVFAERIGPVRFAGPTRFFPPLTSLAALAPIDAVIISHDHYDHLDYATITALRDSPTRFVVPLGVGAHLAYWGIPAARIVELDWWEQTQVRGLQIVSTPARHASGRTVLTDQDATLWSGYALIGPSRRVYFSGDTGLFPAMTEIGERLGPFDLTLIEVGQYHAAWPDWHIGPEQALLAHRLVKGRAFFPIHWALFALAYHTWTEPAERIVAAIQAPAPQPPTVLPRPGESVEFPLRDPAPLPLRWWPSLPHQTAAQAPIQSTQVEGLASP